MRKYVHVYISAVNIVQHTTWQKQEGTHEFERRDIHWEAQVLGVQVARLMWQRLEGHTSYSFAKQRASPLFPASCAELCKLRLKAGFWQIPDAISAACLG